jgi:hypothetical protein
MSVPRYETSTREEDTTKIPPDGGVKHVATIRKGVFVDKRIEQRAENGDVIRRSFERKLEDVGRHIAVL